MIRKIVLENFMSHRRTVIEPSPGLTVLVGPNNCGKSALVVALQCMNTCDTRSAPFIRHGEKEAKVLVEVAPDATGPVASRVEWIRGKNYTNYKINGREMTRARRPEDLDDHLKLAEVESEDKKRTFDLHFAEQKSPIFLLNESGASAATFFAASSDAAYLMQMQSVLARRASEKRSQKRDLEARIDRQKKQLEVYEPLVEIDRQVRQVSDTYLDLQRAQETRIELQKVMIGLEEAVLDRVAYAEDLEALAGLDVPPPIEGTAELGRITSSLERLVSAHERYASRAETLEALPPTPELCDSTPLAEVLRAMESKSRRVNTLSDKLEISAKVSKPPEMEDATDLTRFVADFEARAVAATKWQELLVESTRELDVAKGNVLAYLDKNPTCPTCGALVLAERLLQFGERPL